MAKRWPKAKDAWKKKIFYYKQLAAEHKEQKATEEDRTQLHLVLGW
jgi:hypothetical protein